MPALRSTCGCLSLQVGVATFSAVLMTLSIIILNLNLFNYKTTNTTEVPVARIIVFTFVVFLLMVAILSFLGAYKENRNLILISLGLLLLLAIYWFTMCVFSMAGTLVHISNVCIQKRCATSFWLVRFDYSKRDVQTEYNFPYTYTTVLTDKMNNARHLKPLPDSTANENNALAAEDDYDSIDRSTESTLIFKTTQIKGRNNSRTNKSNLKKKYISPTKKKSNKDWIRQSFNNLYSFQKQHVFRRSPENITIKSNVNESTNDNKKPVYNISTTILEPIHLITEDDYYDEQLDNYGWRLKSGWHLFGLIFLFSTNTIFFFYNGILLWSYADELSYKYVGYDDEEPEEHS